MPNVSFTTWAEVTADWVSTVVADMESTAVRVMRELAPAAKEAAEARAEHEAVVLIDRPDEALEEYEQTGFLQWSCSYSVTGTDGRQYGDDYATVDRLLDVLQRGSTRDFRFQISLPWAYAVSVTKHMADGSHLIDVQCTNESPADILDKLLSWLPPEPAVPDWGKPELVKRAFIGHGGDRQWEAIRGFVQGAGWAVEAYESEERAGEGVLHSVMTMIEHSSVAFLVLSAAEQVVGLDVRRARPNVIHELGLAQMRLGPRRAIVILEDGVEKPSNIVGAEEIRYRTGEIHTLGERVTGVLARTEREHGA